MWCHDVLYTGGFLTLLYNDYVGVADAENLHDGVEGNASGMLGGPEEKSSLWSLAFSCCCTVVLKIVGPFWL